MLARQLFRFAVVGVIGTGTYFALVVALVETGIAKPMVATCLAYSVSFFISYFGHQMWTFERPRSLLGQGPKFLATVLFGFGLNEALFYLIHFKAQLDYRVSVIIAAGIVAAITFFLNKFWVFRAERGSTALD